MPGAVSTVNTSQVSDEVVRVSWTAPEELNGILQQYVLVYREYDRSISEVEVNVPLPATAYNISGLSELYNYTSLYFPLLPTSRYMHNTIFTCSLMCTSHTYNIVYGHMYDCIVHFLQYVLSWVHVILCAQVQLVPFPTAAGVPYSVVVYAVTGGGRGAVSERVTFFSRELGQLRLPGHTICFIHLLCKGNNIYVQA